jgi:hypothetical protein
MSWRGKKRERRKEIGETERYETSIERRYTL